MQPPDHEAFAEWRGHPVTEWIMQQMRAMAANQKAIWAESVWKDETLDPLLLREARVRADCYLAIPESTFEDWKAIDDSEA